MKTFFILTVVLISACGRESGQLVFANSPGYVQPARKNITHVTQCPVGYEPKQWSMAPCRCLPLEGPISTQDYIFCFE